MNESTPRLDPFYYLRYFEQAMQWLSQCYDDLLNEEEHGFLATFSLLPQPSRALLVRLIMRRGNLFRRSRLDYPEIGDIQLALEPLVRLAWIERSPAVSLENLFRLFTRKELTSRFTTLRTATKREALDVARTEVPTSHPLHEWLPEQADEILDVRIAALCARLRALYFGNFHQEWAEFVDLGMFKYEAFELTTTSRAFQSRDQMDSFWRLLECSEMLHLDAPPASILSFMPTVSCDHGWLRDRQNRLLYRIAQRLEKVGESDRALEVYLYAIPIRHGYAPLACLNAWESQ